MKDRLHVASITIALPRETPHTRTTDESGVVSHRFFVDPIIVVAIGESDVAVDVSAVDVAASVRAPYTRTRGFRREPSWDPRGGAPDTCILCFRWTAENTEEQASRLMVIKRDETTVVVHASVPAVRLAEVEPALREILDSVTLS